MSPADSYRILELSMSASRLEVKAAYHKLVRQWHPDRYHLDPDNQPIAERKIREINRAYDVLSKSLVTQSDADVFPDRTSDTGRSEGASFQPPANDVFYSNVEEAIRSATFEHQPQNSGDDAASARRRAAAESQVQSRAACAYVGGDPRLAHIASGFLGRPAVIAWNPWGVTLRATGAASVAYPATSIRSVQLSRRSLMAFLSESTVRLQIAHPEDNGHDGFLVKLRFHDRYAAEFFAGQVEKAFAVERRVTNSWFHPVLLLILLLAVLAGLGIKIGLNANRAQIAIESSNPPDDRPLVDSSEDRNKNQDEASVDSNVQPPVTQQVVAQSDAGAQIDAIAAIERTGGSVIETQGKVVWVKLTGARVDQTLMEQISSLRDLEELNLHATTITGEEFRYLSDLSNLRVLDLSSTQKASAGVKHLTGLTGLQILRLSNTDMGDTELKLLEQLPELEEVEVISTYVTEVGIEQFNASLPLCVVVN